MAASFRNYLGKFALMAAIALWAGCSEADKNAEKSTEQENTVFEFPVDSKCQLPIFRTGLKYTKSPCSHQPILHWSEVV